VVEGPTDFEVLSRLVAAFSPIPTVSSVLQPEASAAFSSYGQTGAGWKGVRAWCNQLKVPLQRYVEPESGPKLDLLVVHIDADVSRDAEIDQSLACPPARHTVNRLRSVIQSWFDVPAQCRQRVLCIPADALETWIAAAYGEPIPECTYDPASLLTRRPRKLLKTKDGRAKKKVSDYRTFADEVVERWGRVAESCLMAKLFEKHCRRVLSS